MAEKPTLPQKRYLTRAGFDRFAAEHRHLWNVERRKVVGEVTVAAALGDRSENADYIYGKRRLREIDRRLGYLTKLLEGATVIDPTDRPEFPKALFGSWVTVEDEDGNTSTYQLVGRDEVAPRECLISIESPLGKLLLGKRVDDEVTFKRPKGEVELVVTRVGNHPPEGWSPPATTAEFVESTVERPPTDDEEDDEEST